MEAFLLEQKAKARTIGFVPTMGALHQGHLSLIESAKKACDICVCSIFVNPNQFNDKEDLKKYPRTPEADIALLEGAQCDVLFMPSVDEVYPEAIHTKYNFGYLDSILEGAHRPGHFNGVAQVVRRLFEIVQPHKAFFGSKDYQQVMVVKSLVQQLQMPINIVACPILREPDGVAMSSRNTLLSPNERKLAGHIPVWMKHAAAMIRSGKSIAQTKQYINAEVIKHKDMNLDYFEICNANDLKILDDSSPCHSRIALIALFVGKIRLIDNINIDEFESPQLN